MIILRSALFALLFGLSVLVYGSALIVAGRILPYRWLCMIGRNWARLVLWLLAHVCHVTYRVSGADRLPAGPAVVLCKHQSAWETIALRAILPPEQTWVLKQELLRIPVFGRALARYEPIAIDRSAGRKAIRQLIAEGCAHLAQGRWVIVFPEGTRVAPGSTKPFGIGGALLSKRSDVEAVPIAHNAGVYWPRQSFRKYPGVIEVVIGAAIDPSEMTALEINTAAETWIARTVGSLPCGRAKLHKAAEWSDT